jgi:hypothetical protein
MKYKPAAEKNRIRSSEPIQPMLLTTACIALVLLSADVLRIFGVVFVRRNFVGSKREMSPNRARHLFLAVCGCFVEFLSVRGGIMASKSPRLRANPGGSVLLPQWQEEVLQNNLYSMLLFQQSR